MYLGVSPRVWLFLAVLIRLEFSESDFKSRHILILLFWLLPGEESSLGWAS